MTTPGALRVLLVADFDDDARLGSAKVTHKLRDELRLAGHYCDALFSDAIGRSPRNRHVRQLVAPALAARAIARASAQQRYDVIDAASAEGLWIGVQKRLGRHRHTALICRSNGLEHLNYRRMLDDSREGLVAKGWSRRLWYPASRLSQVAAAARLSDRLIVLNAADRDFAVRRGWLPPARVDIVPHGVSERFLGAPAGAATRGGGVLFCGSWDHMKGIRYLTEAFGQLARDASPVRLTVLGAGVPASRILEDFPPQARSLVTIIDRVAEERVIEEYRRHDLLVLPSTYEGFGLVVIEAMSQGLPVVATPVGCVPETVRDGETGVIVAARDSDALAGAIRRLMQDPSARARLGIAAAASVATMSWGESARRTVDAYRRALAEISA